MFNRILKRVQSVVACSVGQLSRQHLSPKIIPRSKHNISRRNISPNAQKVLHRLHKAGYQAYLVGGSVRDLLLGYSPKDFDVTTDATPEQIKQVFSNCRLIGRRFRLAHIFFSNELIEVATFRASGHQTGKGHKKTGQGMLLRDNVYGTIDEDAARRDFTVNALYYNIHNFTLYSYAGGLEDIKLRCLRLLGKPANRYTEDPVRMLRAIRFSTKLHFTIAKESQQPIFKLGHMLQEVSKARLLDESLKLFQSGFAWQNFIQLRKFDLLKYILPLTARHLEDHDDERQAEFFLKKALTDTDRRVVKGLPVSGSFIFACLLWHPLQVLVERELKEGCNAHIALQQSCAQLFGDQDDSVTIPRKMAQNIRDIWLLQNHFTERSPRRIHRLYNHPSFRAAYDFLLLRANLNANLSALSCWWQDFQAADKNGQQQLLATLSPKSSNKNRRKKQKPIYPQKTA